MRLYLDSTCWHVTTHELVEEIEYGAPPGSSANVQWPSGGKAPVFDSTAAAAVPEEFDEARITKGG